MLETGWDGTRKKKQKQNKKKKIKKPGKED